MSPERDEERRRNRPYRRFLGILFAIVVTAASVVVLRGIIRTLDRLPSAEGINRPKIVDVRALRACAEDLERLEGRVRRVARKALTETITEDAPDWVALSQSLEVERLTIVARCRLDEPTHDPAADALRRAATAIEDLLRTYGLLYARFLSEGVPRSIEVHSAAKEALRQLDKRN